MTPTRAEVELLQRRCRDGYCGPHALANAHGLLAECCRAMGALLAEVERLRALATCGCGDGFTTHDPGTCGACLASMARFDAKAKA